ncbi:MAG: ABC transporter permease [Treponema sp.]|nr:ABC transporter permease [Treponema sp.]
MVASILIEGLIYGIMVLGLFMTFRVLNFCDMTVDGSFPMGGCVLAACLTHGIAPSVALLLAFCAGICAGLVTTLVYTKLRVPDLLAGILVMTMLYSINLRIMSNHANVSFLKIPTIFSKIISAVQKAQASFSPDWAVAAYVFAVVLVLCLLLNLFYNTDFGLTMGALGANEQMVVSQGVNVKFMRGCGICFGNAFASLSGAFFAMYSGFADVGSGTGVVVSGLASLMLGEFVLRSNRIALQLARVLLGSIIYRALMFLGRRYGYVIGMNSNDLKLITGLLIILCLIISKYDIAKFLREHLARPAKDGEPKNAAAAGGQNA